VEDELFDLDLLVESDAFKVDAQSRHLIKHLRLGIEIFREVWAIRPECSTPPNHPPVG